MWEVVCRTNLVKMQGPTYMQTVVAVELLKGLHIYVYIHIHCGNPGEVRPDLGIKRRLVDSNHITKRVLLITRSGS